MTTKEFKAIRYGLKSHIGWEDEHISVYESTNFTPTIKVRVFSKVKGPQATTRRVFYFMGKTFRNKDSLLKAINEYQNNQQ